MLAGQMSPNHDMGFSGPDFMAVWELDPYGSLSFFCPFILSLNEMAGAQLQNLRGL